MVQSKHRGGLLFFIFSIPFFYFLTSNNNKPATTNVKKETRESSTQTLQEQHITPVSDIQIRPEESAPIMSETSSQSKRILDYFAYFVSK